MDENRQNKTESKPIATEDKLWLPPLSPKDQEKLDRLRKRRTEANNKKRGMREQGNPFARFFKVWATPLSILIATATLLWSVYQFDAQQQSDRQKVLDQGVCGAMEQRSGLRPILS